MKVGVIGGGQLGRMMALAGAPLGLRFVFLDPSPEACAGDFGDLIIGNYDDPEAIEQLIQQVDIVTFEFESVPPATVEQIAKALPVYPSAHSLSVARERWAEKTLFSDLNIPTAPVYKVESQQDLELAIQEIGVPAIIKTRTLGYDGKGQKLLKIESDVENTFIELGSVPLIYEGFVDFDTEVSCIAVRGTEGKTRIYPLVENEHRQGILHQSTPLSAHPLQSLAEEYATKVMDHLDYVGVLTFEFFVYGDQLIANEMAPRVHNSGHWTIEGSVCSQFENHVRAISGLPLGDTSALGHATMFNLIGCDIDQSAFLQIEGCCVHDYRKAPKPGRKIGHLTCISGDQIKVEQAAASVEALLNNQLS